MYDNIRNNPVKRLAFLFTLFLSRAADAVGKLGEDVGHLFFHLTTYKGRIGYIDIDVDEEQADGLIRYRRRNDYGQVVLMDQPFRISNRWLLRGRNVLGGVALLQVRTDADTMHGMDVHSVVLGSHLHNRRVFKPFDLTQLPSEEEIAARHARMKRFQDFMGRLFPARAPANGLSREEIAELIVKRI
ncbi:hypothetical protein [Xanthomonas phage RTH11]|nr:hypothetical protein [Xanthomonas phage RTH11]